MVNILRHLYTQKSYLKEVETPVVVYKVAQYIDHHDLHIVTWKNQPLDI